MPLSGIAIHKNGAKRRPLHSSFLIRGKLSNGIIECCPSLHSIKNPACKKRDFQKLSRQKIIQCRERTLCELLVLFLFRHSLFKRRDEAEIHIHRLEILSLEMGNIVTERTDRRFSRKCLRLHSMETGRRRIRCHDTGCSRLDISFDACHLASKEKASLLSALHRSI